MYESVKLLCDVQSYSGPDLSIRLFDTSKTQTVFHRNPVWEWNDWTNEQWNSTESKWKEIGFVILPGFEPGTVVAPLALICSALDCCVCVFNYLTVLECLKGC